MSRKNPENKQLRIVTNRSSYSVNTDIYIAALSNLVVAEATLVRAGKDSAMPHFIAIVKELERLCGFRFETMELELEIDDNIVLGED